MRLTQRHRVERTGAGIVAAVVLIGLSLVAGGLFYEGPGSA